MDSDKFCLCWNDFENNFSSSLKDLREEKDFFDVTIACDDSQMQAHKVILSACSTFFRNILRRNPHQHPLLYLKGVKYSELLSILNFMYMGEVNVAQEELNSFLSVAEDLKVKGLTQGNSSQPNKSNNITDQEKVLPPKPVKEVQSTLPRVHPQPQHQSQQVQRQTHEAPIVKCEPSEAPQQQLVQVSSGYNNGDVKSTSHPDQGSLVIDSYEEEEAYEYQYEEYDSGIAASGSRGMLDENAGELFMVKKGTRSKL